MADTIWTDGVTTVTQTAPTFPYTARAVPRQTIGVSKGGFTKISIDGDTEQFYALNYVRLTNTEKNDLMAFIQDDLVYHKNTFTWTDPWGTSHTNVRLWRIRSWFTLQQRSNRWNFSCELRDEIT